MRARWPLLLLVPATLACGLRTAAALRDPDVRVELSGELMATLERQDHYFASEAERRAFELRMRRVAQGSRDAASYYRAVSDALADLGEGHTGLVGSAQVPFSSTIPPAALLESDGQPVVAGVAPGVEGGGLRPGDVILAVDDLPAAKALDARLRTTAGSTPHARRARAVANLLAGPTRDPARVRVRGVDGRERLCYPLRFLLDDEGTDRFRFGFLARSVTAQRITASAAYVALPDFHPDRYRELAQALRILQALPTLILDLRGNPGGRIRTLQRVAGLFVDEPVELLLLKDGELLEPLRAAPGPLLYRGELKILVDERTGSAAELLAAAFADLGRATIYGRLTAGSARSRLSSLLPGGVVFHYAGRAEFLRRDGRPIEGVGVGPDVVYRPARVDLAGGAYGDPVRDPGVRLALGQN
ncbi:MAG: S41 family peptidase [Planctomycetota bacterium]|jgi:C-terminal processing protease CtpA/Prc